MKWSELSRRPLLNLLKLILVFVATGFAFYFVLRAAGLLAPFALALLCAMAMEPIIRKLCKMHIKKHYFPRSIASILTMLVMGTIVGVALFFLIYQIVLQFFSLVQSIPGWVTEFSAQLQNIALWTKERIGILPEDVAASVVEQISNLLSTLVRQLSTIVNPLARGVWTTAQRIPIIILSVMMFLVGTFYMCSWRPRMTRFMRSALPVHWMKRMEDVKKRLFSTMLGYLRAQLLLLSGVFVIILVGLNILGAEYALVIALIIACLDALPVLGSGLFLNTWAIYCLATGDLPQAIGLFLTYLAVLVGRNLLEPRLVSGQIGLPPLVTMAAMYAGFRLFGVLGLIGGPILMIILRMVYEYYAQGRTLRQILNGDPPTDVAEPSPDSPPEGA